MFYYLKKTKPSKTRPDDIYLQIYTSSYVPKTKSKKHRCIESLGYVSELKAKGIEDPIAFYKKKCEEMNLKLRDAEDEKISKISRSTYFGNFLINALFNTLNLDRDLDIVGYHYQSDYKFSSLFRTFCFAHILNVYEDYKISGNLSKIYGFDYHPVEMFRFINFLGQDYHKYIEVFNKHINDIWNKNIEQKHLSYYFEIAINSDSLTNGSILLDSNLIPLDIEFYNNEVYEKSNLRTRIENLKAKNEFDGRIIKVADGKFDIKNIYETLNDNDGYIHSISIFYTSDSFKKWVLENESWINVYDDNKNLLFKYKQFESSSNESITNNYIDFEDGIESNKYRKFKVREKRILIYDPSIAEDEKMIILKGINYLKDGVDVKELLKFAGYKFFVTTEVNTTVEDIYNIYQKYCYMQDYFRILDSYLKDIPIYYEVEEITLGYFLICYISLTLLRLLETKIFEDEIPIEALIKFMGEYLIVESRDKSFVNISTISSTLIKIKEKFGLYKLDEVHLSLKDVNNIFNFKYDI